MRRPLAKASRGKMNEEVAVVVIESASSHSDPQNKGNR